MSREAKAKIVGRPVRSAVSGIVWPAVPDDGNAMLLSLLYQLDHSQWLEPQQIRLRQLGQLRLLLRHAIDNVPLYARTLQGLHSEDVGEDAIGELPILGRRDLQASFEALCSQTLPEGHGQVGEGQSSGSTGMPVRFLQTGLTQLFWNALTLREHAWHGRDFNGKLAAIRIKVEEKRWPDWGLPVRALYRTGPAATLNVRTDVDTQLDWLFRENPEYLITHASNLAALAEASLRRGVNLPALRQARSYSELLTQETRNLVMKAWGVGVADMYSCEEAGHIALQCAEHGSYHIQSENLLVEVIDDEGRPCGPGETGRVVLTTLHNFAMPLIRYEVGDYAEVGEACPCGRGLPVLRRIHGRRRNMIVLPDGRRHWPSFPAEIWREVAPVEQFRLVQRAPGTIDAEYVMPRELTSEEKSQLESSLASRFGHRFEIAWKHCATIERGPGYKFEDFVSEL